MSGDVSPEEGSTIRQTSGEAAGSQELSLPQGADQHPEAPAIAGYLLTHPIGRGAFAQVWKAFQLRTRRWVAVKVFLDQDRLNMAMLKREEELLVRLDKHPHVVALLDADLSGSPPFFAMELIESGSLEGECAKRRDAGRVGEWFEQLARALAFVHAKGLIHCDLKPANVLLDEEGRVRVADFGQARAVSRSSGALGTFFYMAPEQAVAGEASAPDVRWDVYALGATVYALLTGRPPHAETLGREVTEAATLEARLGAYRAAVERGEGDLGGLEGADEDLAAIVRKCLRFDPARRYQSASEVLADLEARRRGLPVSGLAHLRGYRARKFLRRNLAASVVAALAAAGLAFAGAQIVRERDALRRQLAVSYSIQAQQAAETGNMAVSALYAAESDRLAPSRQARDNALAFLSIIAAPKAMAPGRLAAASADGRVVLLVDGAGARAYRPDGEPAGPDFALESPILAAALSRDGAMALLGGEDGAARVFDVRTGAPAGPPLRHGGKVVSVRLSPDGLWAATGSEDGFSRIWSVDGGRPQGAPLDLGNHVHAVWFSPDSKTLLSVSEEALLARLSRVPGNEPFGRTMRHGARIYASDFAPDGRTVLTGGADGTVRLWSARDGAPAGTPMRHQGRVMKALFSPDSRMVATSSWDETARLWDARTGAPVGRPMRHEGAVRDVVFTSGGRRVLTASEDHAARLWDAGTGAPLGRMMRHPALVVRAAAAAEDAGLITTSGDRTYFWRFDDAPPAETVRRRAAPVRASGGERTLAANGSVVVTAAGALARLRDAKTGAPLGKPMEHNETINAAALSPDGTWLATAGDDRAVRLWRVPAATRIERTLRHLGRALAVAISADGRSIATGDDAGNARVWNSATGAAGRLMRNDGPVVATAFSPDGRTLVTAGAGTARLWDVATGLSIGPPLRHESPVSSAAFSADGGTLVAACLDGTEKAWPLPWLGGGATASGLTLEAQRASARFVDSEGEIQLLDLDRWRRLKPSSR